MSSLTLPEKALARVVDGLPDNALSATRTAALDRFLARGFPTTGQEDWKYTDLAPLADISRRWLDSGAPVPAASILAERIEAIRVAVDADWIVIANGIVQTPYVGADNAIRITSLSERAMVPGYDQPLADLNAALLTDGLHISVRPGKAAVRLLGLLVIDSAEGQPGVVQTRVRIEVQPGARAQFVEYHASEGAAEHYANSVVELSLAEGAAVDYVRLQARGARHSQTHRTAIRLDRGAVLRYAGFDLGGRLVRNDLDIELAAEDADAIVDGLYIASEGQHLDNHVRIDHLAGPARSRQEYRGILSGRCRCVWNGKAIVRPGADGTDAEQANHNLLLSEQSEIDAKPELEIYADEVKCSHGTTVGQLDEAALFYLRSRGLDRETATRVLTRAFGAAIVSRAPVTAITERLAALVDERLALIRAGGDA